MQIVFRAKGEVCHTDGGKGILLWLTWFQVWTTYLKRWLT